MAPGAGPVRVPECEGAPNDSSYTRRWRSPLAVAHYRLAFNLQSEGA